MARKSLTWWVDERVRREEWKEVPLSPHITGLDQEVSIFEGQRKSSFIKHFSLSKKERKETWCPPIWYDLAIGSGPCGLLCRSCFLILTHRIKRDPRRHLIYTNYDDMKREVKKWLMTCPPHTTLGLGIDCSDSLLYDRYTGITRWIIPLFGNPKQNPNNAELVLLTKSANVDQLQDLPHNHKVIASFSLNPQPIADLWEGIAPPIDRRLEAGLKAQAWGYNYRWRLDPILTPPGWQAIYLDFFKATRKAGHRPSRITLGTYREKNTQLSLWAEKWGIPPMDWEPPDLVKQGSHYHLPHGRRKEIYAAIIPVIQNYFPESQVALCKETHTLRRELGVCNAACNCLNTLGHKVLL